MLDLDIVEILLTLAAVILALYYYNTVTHDYWAKKNVPGPRPLPFFGNFKDVIFFNTSGAEKFRDLHIAYKNEPIVGLFQGRTPILMIHDPELLKHIFIKDFTSFTDRGLLVNEKADPLSAHLFSIEGQRWKQLRTKLSPVFTSGKLRKMFYLLTECADHFENNIHDLVAKGKPIECREITAKFTTDVIGSCAFGINMNALASEESDFRKMGNKVFEPSFANTARRLVREFSPGLFRFLQIRTFAKDVTNFFMGSMKETVEYRKKNNVVRHDFVDLLMQIQTNSDKIGFELTDDLLAAQAFVFFLAGFETSSTTISFALYELAQAQVHQDKLRAEIVETLKMHGGQLTYDTIKEMKFLEMVFQETLRKHPPIPLLTRQTVKEYTIPGSNVHLPVGQRILIPVLGLHHNPEYYPKPELFDPQRFSEEAIQERHPMIYLPFGEGPRNCIGARFAVFQTKMGIIKVLKNYRLTPSKNMEIPYKIDRKSFVLTPADGIHLTFSKIK